MHDSASLAEAGQRWQEAADALLAEAERIGPLDGGVFGELGTDDEGADVARRVDARVDDLLREGDRVFGELVGPAGESADARFQAVSLLVGSLAVGDALAVADQSPADVFGELGVADVQTGAFAEARTTLAEAGAVVAVPSSLSESLEKLESAGATESWKVLTGSAGKLAGGALAQGLQGLLRGAAAAAFDDVLGRLDRWRDALRRGTVRIAKWVVEKVRALLPDALADRLEDLVEAVQERLEAAAGGLATDLYGRVLGRQDVEDAWGGVEDTSQVEGRIPGITATHVARIAWVTKGRKAIDKLDLVVAGMLGQLPVAGQLAFAALVAAVLGFVAFQVWDGFNDLEALV